MKVLILNPAESELSVTKAARIQNIFDNKSIAKPTGHYILY